MLSEPDSNASMQLHGHGVSSITCAPSMLAMKGFSSLTTRRPSLNSSSMLSCLDGSMSWLCTKRGGSPQNMTKIKNPHTEWNVVTQPKQSRSCQWDGLKQGVCVPISGWSIDWPQYPGRSLGVRTNLPKPTTCHESHTTHFLVFSHNTLMISYDLLWVTIYDAILMSPCQDYAVMSKQFGI